jgi:hypothetical protein
MKVLLAVFLMLFVPLTAGRADVCVKQSSHSDGYYNGGMNYPPEDEESETWISGDKMAVVGAGRSIIINSSDSLMIFVNHTDSSFVEIELPMDWAAVVGEQLAGRLMSFQRHGEVKETSLTKEVEGLNCKGYEVASWILYEGNRYYEMETTVWVTTDLPVDLDAYAAMVDHIGGLRNYHDDFVKELGKIRGVQMTSETVNYRHGFSFDSNESLIEAYEGDPPGDVYSVPEGYTKKEQLSMQDLRG